MFHKLARALALVSTWYAAALIAAVLAAAVYQPALALNTTQPGQHFLNHARKTEAVAGWTNLTALLGVDGFATPEDGGRHRMVYDAASKCGADRHSAADGVTGKISKVGSGSWNINKTYSSQSINYCKFSAIDDEVANDTSTITNAVSAISALAGGNGGALLLESPLSYYVSRISLPNSFQIKGQARTTIKCWSTPCMVMIGNQATAQNLVVQYAGTTGSESSSVGVQVGAGELGSQPTLRDLFINGFGTGIDWQSSNTRKMYNVSVKGDAQTQLGIRVRDTNTIDSGDDTIHGTTVDMNANPRATGLRYESGGGLKVSGFKGLGGAYGFLGSVTSPNLSTQPGTQDLMLSGSSLENMSVACFAMSAGTPGVQFGNITIGNNELDNCPIGVWLEDNTSTNASISGNVFGALVPVPIRIEQDADGVAVGSNAFQSKTLVVDNRTNFKEYGFIDRRDTESIGSTSTTAWTTAYSVTLPPNRGIKISIELEGVLQGAGSFNRNEEFLLTNLAGSLGNQTTSISSTTAGFGTPSTKPIDFQVDALSGASFTGSITGNVLTVSGITYGAVQVGQVITGAGVPGALSISSQSGGTVGGVGVYRLGRSAPQPVASEAMIAPGTSLIQFRIGGSGGTQLEGTATIIPTGKAITVMRGQ